MTETKKEEKTDREKEERENTNQEENTTQETQKDSAKKEETFPQQGSPEQIIAELTELLKRTQANFENYRKQTEKRVEDLHLMAAKQVILEVLPVYDHLQLALKSVQQNIEQKVKDEELQKENKNQEHQNPQEFVEGIVLIAAQFRKILQDLGVQEIPSKGEKLNPYLHEPLLTVESDVPVGIIVEEFQSGFTLHGQVIRHAKVKVSAGKKQNEKKQENKES